MRKKCQNSTMGSDDPCGVCTVCRCDSDVLSEAGTSHNVYRQSSLHCAEGLQNLLETIRILLSCLSNNVTLAFFHTAKLTLLKGFFNSFSFLLPKPETLTHSSSYEHVLPLSSPKPGSLSYNTLPHTY